MRSIRPTPFNPASLSAHAGVVGELGPRVSPTICSIQDDFYQPVGGAVPPPPPALHSLEKYLKETPPLTASTFKDFLNRNSGKIVGATGAVIGIEILLDDHLLHELHFHGLIVLGSLIFAGLIWGPVSYFRGYPKDYVHNLDRSALSLRQRLEKAEELTRKLEKDYLSHAMSDDLSLAVEWQDTYSRLKKIIREIQNPPSPYDSEPHRWTRAIRDLRKDERIHKTDHEAAGIYEDACRRYPALVAFADQPLMRRDEPFPMSLPRFLAHPVPGVRLLKSAGNAPDADDQRPFQENLRVVGWNVNLWGHLSASPGTTEGLRELAEIYAANDHKIPAPLLEKDWPLFGTSFNWRDRKRAKDIADYFISEPGDSRPDVICLQEVFDHVIAENDLWPKLQKEYPYCVMGASGLGIPGILLSLASRHPSLISLLTKYRVPTQEMINSLLGGYYIPPPKNEWEDFVQGIKEDFLSTKMVMELVSELFFEDPSKFWGSGTVIFSRHPILQFGYQRHPSRTDFELFTNKGVLWADVSVSPSQIVRVFNSHMNDGHREYNERVRLEQADALARAMAASPYPAILLADMNASPGSPPYERFLHKKFGIRDGFVEAHPRTSLQAISFDPQNPFARRKGAGDAVSEIPGRIDHLLLRGEGIRAKPGCVFYEDRWKREKRSDESEFWLTDHSLLRGDLFLRRVTRRFT